MIRSKDLVIFVSVLFILLIAIIATVSVRHFQSNGSKLSVLPDIDTSINQNYEAVTDTKERDREEAIAHLRSKLAEGAVIEASPSVEASPQLNEGLSSLGECVSPDTGILVARQWPLSDVSMAIRDGVRLVTHDISITQSAPAGSSTSSTSTQNTISVTHVPLLQLPVSPLKLPEAVCPSSEIIGVTVIGSLMFNSDATIYRTAGSETVIGYALDGFPIYGPYGGQLDECGGYDSPTGYRYTVSQDTNTVLNCFVGQPKVFQNI